MSLIGCITTNFVSRVTQSVYILVSGYGLHDRAIEVRSPAEAKDSSSSLWVQTGSGAHPVFCTMDNRVLSPGVKRGRGVTLTIHPPIWCRGREWVGALPPLPQAPACGVVGQLWFQLFLITNFTCYRFFWQTCFSYVRFQVLTAASMMFSCLIPDDGGSTHLWNVGRSLFYTAVYPRRQL
jgi:hypothetical protein